ncbi:MAG: hypothetical protein ACUVX8_07170 [Candidatus Zipacnadales bacterium]
MELPSTPDHEPTRNAARAKPEWAEEMLTKHGCGEMPETVHTKEHSLRVGEGLFLAHDGEVFCEFGIALRSRFAPCLTFVVSYTNNVIGYVSDSNDYARGGYTTTTVPKMIGTFPYTTDVGIRLTNAPENVGPEALV